MKKVSLKQIDLCTKFQNVCLSSSAAFKTVLSSERNFLLCRATGCVACTHNGSRRIIIVKITRNQLRIALCQLFADKTNQHQPTVRPETRSTTSFQAETRKSFKSISAIQIIIASLAPVPASHAEPRISLPADAAKFNLDRTGKCRNSLELRNMIALNAGTTRQ